MRINRNRFRTLAKLLLAALWCAWLPCMLIASGAALAHAAPAALPEAASDHAHHDLDEASHAASPAPAHQPLAGHHECVVMHGALALRAAPDLLPPPQALSTPGAALATPRASSGLTLQPSESESAATRRALLQVFLN